MEILNCGDLTQEISKGEIFSMSSRDCSCDILIKNDYFSPLSDEESALG